MKATKEHAEQLRDAFNKNLELPIPAASKAAIPEEASRMAAYGKMAEELVALSGNKRSAALAKLPEFQKQFKVLEGRMDKLDDLVEQTQRNAESAHAVANLVTQSQQESDQANQSLEMAVSAMGGIRTSSDRSPRSFE